MKANGEDAASIWTSNMPMEFQVFLKEKYIFCHLLTCKHMRKGLFLETKVTIRIQVRE